MADGSPTHPGAILFPKPVGVTSHDCVAAVRRTFPRGVKVGHAGTLDPFASGLLLVLVGSATRTQRWLMDLPKIYIAIARLGWRSDTGDRDGRLEETGQVPETLEIPVGTSMQRPPAYSAVHVGGERLYEKARRGEPEEGEPRPVTVHQSRLLWRDEERAAFQIECSSGTYVRQLIAALGDAYCDELARTAIGPFRLDDADPSHVVPLAEALGFMPSRSLAEEEAAALRHGRTIPIGTAPEGSELRALHGERLVAIVERREEDLQPVVVFPA